MEPLSPGTHHASMGIKGGEERPAGAANKRAASPDSAPFEQSSDNPQLSVFGLCGADGKHRRGRRKIVRNFTFSWFSVNMGTGVVSTPLHELPFNAPWSCWISVVLFALNTGPCVRSYYMASPPHSSLSPLHSVHRIDRLAIYIVSQIGAYPDSSPVAVYVPGMLSHGIRDRHQYVCRRRRSSVWQLGLDDGKTYVVPGYHTGRRPDRLIRHGPCGGITLQLASHVVSNCCSAFHEVGQ